MDVSCVNCVFCEQVVKDGDIFTILDPHGDEIERQHASDVFICRALPPITGSWPEVTTSDWCGKWKSTP